MLFISVRLIREEVNGWLPIRRQRPRPATWPELTNRPPGTGKGTEGEHHTAFLVMSGAARSGVIPSWFSDGFFDGDQT